MFTRILFYLTLSLALALGTLVLLGPWLAPGGSGPGTWKRLLDLYAWDTAVRQTSLGCALGLLVTAVVFFRRPPAPKPREERPAPHSGPAVGA